MRPVTKIEKITADILDIPTIRGHVLAMTTMTQQSFVLVRIQFSDGSCGIGEGTSIGGLSYGCESPESIASAITTYIAPMLQGQAANNVNALITRMEKVVKGNFIARSAVEMALWDGLARRLDLSISALFGGAQHASIQVAWTLASGDSARDIEEAEEMLATRRHRIFKLKIGNRSVEDDLAHVGAIAKAVAGRASIRVDVNQAWSLQQARWGAAGLQDLGVDLIEQPLAAHDRAGMAELVASHKIAIMADEALNGPKDALAMAQARAADVYAVKVAQSGGLAAAREVCAMAEAAGLGLYGGTMLECGVGSAAGLQLFATRKQMQWGCELFGPLLFKDEILATPLVYRDFDVHLPAGPGIGVELDADKTKYYRRG
ncbi:muconate cycloisomerase [Epibacterium sp. SM1969]|uniref:Muconate cycloisomerase n=1 Tax=Tritonibacter aquimaris TaxID=2663379 RepID=A0A844ANJ8_9RHOB|nr:muconate/chloromuconate family cycloisomerase [Tritonibacter aquimaris]MQY43989.1 muconate cycloisomerase [Tritonibacter aquimaris]